MVAMEVMLPPTSFVTVGASIDHFRWPGWNHRHDHHHLHQPGSATTRSRPRGQAKREHDPPADPKTGEGDACSSVNASADRRPALFMTDALHASFSPERLEARAVSAGYRNDRRLEVDLQCLPGLLKLFELRRCLLGLTDVPGSLRGCE
jgi:hypothetical protein